MFRTVISAKTFIEAATKGQFVKVRQYLMEHTKDTDGAAVNASWKNGDTALIAAVVHNQINIVDILLRVPAVNINAANQDGNTPLIFAAVYGRKEIFDMLMTKHATNVNTINQDGFTALSKAAMQGHIDIVKTLLKVPDINISIVNIFGRHAADEAAVHGQLDIAALIRAHAEAAHVTLPAHAPRAPIYDDYDEDEEFGQDETLNCRMM
jgi:ankyrin repeat protein